MQWQYKTTLQLIQVQLGYGESEPQTFSSSNQVHKCLSTQILID